MKIQYYDYLLINNWSLAACQSHVSVNVKITGILSQFRYYDVLIVNATSQNIIAKYAYF